VIWVIMGVGGGLLFLAIVIRLIRRIRRRKATHGPLLPRDPAGSRRQPSGQELNA
jgi:O-antigen ligase